jgi:hypothetical protein
MARRLCHYEVPRAGWRCARQAAVALWGRPEQVDEREWRHPVGTASLSPNQQHLRQLEVRNLTYDP